MKAILFFTIVIMLHVGCMKICPPSAADDNMRPPIIYFSLTDSTGNNLFFGKDSVYNPHNVKLHYYDTAAYAISYDMLFNPRYKENYFSPFHADDTYHKCFILYVARGRTAVFHIEFMPGNIDTVKVESSIVNYRYEYEGEKDYDCPVCPVYSERLFFNNRLVCEDCGYYSNYIIAVK